MAEKNLCKINYIARGRFSLITDFNKPILSVQIRLKHGANSFLPRVSFLSVWYLILREVESV